MPIYPFDPNDWLVSLTRSLKSYVEEQEPFSLVGDAGANVEMSFPNTREWTKETPLPRSLVHFEMDDEQSPLWGFGNPGKSEVLLDDNDEPTGYVLQTEGQRHRVNFDVGVWTSAQTGGATQRLVLMQALKNLFGPAGARTALQEATGGIWIVGFEGGSHLLDRINDIPIWRGYNMTLVAEVFSRHVPANLDGDYVPTDFDQDPGLVINVDGELEEISN